MSFLIWKIYVKFKNCTDKIYIKERTLKTIRHNGHIILLLMAMLLKANFSNVQGSHIIFFKYYKYKKVSLLTKLYKGNYSGIKQKPRVEDFKLFYMYKHSKKFIRCISPGIVMSDAMLTRQLSTPSEQRSKYPES